MSRFWSFGDVCTSVRTTDFAFRNHISIVVLPSATKEMVDFWTQIPQFNGWWFWAQGANLTHPGVIDFGPLGFVWVPVRTADFVNRNRKSIVVLHFCHNLFLNTNSAVQWVAILKFWNLKISDFEIKKKVRFFEYQLYKKRTWFRDLITEYPKKMGFCIIF